MDADERIADEFDRLLTLDADERAVEPASRQAIFNIVCLRCQKDMSGLDSILDQNLPESFYIRIVDCLRKIDEPQLARHINSMVEWMRSHEFFEHSAATAIPEAEKADFEERFDDAIGDQLWDLDEKLGALLDDEAAD